MSDDIPESKRRKAQGVEVSTFDLIARIRSLESELFAAQSKLPRWRSREIESPPTDGTPFLVWAKNGDVFEIGSYYKFERDAFDQIDGTDTYRKRVETYGESFDCNFFEWWMPLPEPPTP